MLLLSRRDVGLRDIITHPLPFCSGTLPVTQNDLVLYYGKEEIARYSALTIDSGSQSLTFELQPINPLPSFSGRTGAISKCM